MKDGSPFRYWRSVGELEGPNLWRVGAHVRRSSQRRRTNWSLRIHDRMPLILAPADYTRWLSDEPDPGDLMRPFPAEPMRMWPISTRVNKPENDDPTIALRFDHTIVQPRDGVERGEIAPSCHTGI